MELAEKRLIVQLRDDVVPKYQKELQSTTGASIEYDIAWDTFAANRAALDNLEDKALKVINGIFKEITADKVGKETVASEIKTVQLPLTDGSSVHEFTLSDNVLRMPWDWDGWANSFYPDLVREKIEGML